MNRKELETAAQKAILENQHNPAAPEKIRQQLFLTNPDAATVEAFDHVFESGLLKTDDCPVVDAAGQPLEVDKIYLYTKYSKPIKIKIRRWSFGAGNMLARYYRVFYTDENLEDSFLVVDASYPKGVFGGAVYKSNLVKNEQNRISASENG